MTDKSTGAEVETYIYDETSVEDGIVKGIAYAKDSYPTKVEAIEENEVTGEARHIKMTFDSKIICKDSYVGMAELWKSEFELYCNEDGDRNDPIVSANFSVDASSDTCRVRVAARHKAGCPQLEATAVIKFFSNNPAIGGLVFLMLGVIATFFGARVFNEIVAVVGGLATFIITLLLLSIFGFLKALDTEAAGRHPGWIILAILCFAFAAALALGVAWLNHKYKRGGAAFFGFWVGFVVGYLIYSIIFAYFVSSTYLKFVIIFASAISTAYYAFMWSRTLTVPITAVFGAFFICKGFSMFVGGFPATFQEYTEGQEEFKMQISYIYYLIAYILFLVAGTAHQRYRGYHTLYDNDQFSALSIVNNKDDDYLRMHAIN